MRMGKYDVFHVLEKIGIAAILRKIIDAGSRIDQKIVVYKSLGKAAV